MKLYSVDPNGNFVLKTETSGKKITKRAVFGICFQISPDGSEVDLKVAAPDGSHRDGLVETDIIKQMFMIKELGGKPIQFTQGQTIETEGFGHNPPTPDEPPPPPPPVSGVLSTDELRKRKVINSPTTQRQLA